MPPDAAIPPDLEQWGPGCPPTVGIVGAGVMASSLAAIVGRTARVVMVCRSAEAAAAISARGVRTSGLIEAEARPVVVRSIPELRSVGGVSILFVATKTNAIPEVAAALRPVLGEIGDRPAAPFVVSYQNGIEPGRQLIEVLGDDRVLRMVLNFGGISREIGHAEVTLNSLPHYIGCLNTLYKPVCHKVAELLTAAGFETSFDPQIERRVWTKGLINAAMNPVAALVNANVGQVLDSPAEQIVDALLREGLTVAWAQGLAQLGLDDSFLATARALLEEARTHTPSMVQDIRAGRPSEVGQLNRQIVEHAARLGVPVPTHRVILSLIETFDWKVYQQQPEGAPAQSRPSSPLGPL
jgi:2-dehydropantoate 2-reductase